MDGMKRTLLTDGIRPFPHRKTMLYEVENDVFLAILKLQISMVSPISPPQSSVSSTDGGALLPEFINQLPDFRAVVLKPVSHFATVVL